MENEIKILRYDDTLPGKIQFYIMEIEPMEMLKLFSGTEQIEMIKFMIEKGSDVVYPEDMVGGAATLAEFFDFLGEGETISIEDFSLQLKNGTVVMFHDDMEMNLMLPDTSVSREFLKKVLNYHGYVAEAVLELLKQNTSHYIGLQPNGQLKGVFENFEVAIDDPM